jgi:hypothetical protein
VCIFPVLYIREKLPSKLNDDKKTQACFKMQLPIGCALNLRVCTVLVWSVLPQILYIAVLFQ